jgi:hypothetical protein
VAEGDGLLNADQPVGHLRFSSQILAFQSLPRSTDLAAIGSRDLVWGAGRDNFRDSLSIQSEVVTISNGVRQSLVLRAMFMLW